MYGEVGFEPLRQLAAGQHDPPSTAFAFETNVRAQPYHGPFVGTAGMLFS